MSVQKKHVPAKSEFQAWSSCHYYRKVILNTQVFSNSVALLLKSKGPETVFGEQTHPSSNREVKRVR